MHKLTNNERKLIIKYMPLAEKRAKYHFSEYSSSKLFLTLDDFKSFSYDALCHAVKNYKSDKGASIETYIIDYIRYKMSGFVVHENSSLKLPHNSTDKDERKNIRNIGISNSLAVPIASTPSNFSDVNSYEDVICIQYEMDLFEEIEYNSLLKFIFENITPKEKQLFDLLYIKNLSCVSVAEILSVHPNTIYRNKKKLTTKLKEILKNKEEII